MRGSELFLWFQIARRLKLRNIPEFRNYNGGAAIEICASRADNPLQFSYVTPLTSYKDCNFSYAGLKTAAFKHISNQEIEHNIIGDQVIPNIYNLCASFQLIITKHICHRTQRAMAFIDRLDLLPENKRVLVNILFNYNLINLKFRISKNYCL